MPKSRGRKPKKKRTPASAPKKRLDNFHTTPQEPALSTQPPQEPPLATAPRQEQPTPKIKQIAKLTTVALRALEFAAADQSLTDREMINRLWDLLDTVHSKRMFRQLSCQVLPCSGGCGALAHPLYKDMSEYKVTWERGGGEFSYQKYPRDHTWSFDGGHTQEP
jgi:hypothetical protein